MTEGRSSAASGAGGVVNLVTASENRYAVIDMLDGVECVFGDNWYWISLGIAHFVNADIASPEFPVGEEK